MRDKIESLIKEYKERLAEHYKELRHEKNATKNEMHATFISCYGTVICELEEIWQEV